MTGENFPGGGRFLKYRTGGGAKVIVERCQVQEKKSVNFLCGKDLSRPEMMINPSSPPPPPPARLRLSRLEEGAGAPTNTRLVARARDTTQGTRPRRRRRRRRNWTFCHPSAVPQFLLLSLALSSAVEGEENN